MTVDGAKQTLIYGIYPISQRPETATSPSTQTVLTKWQLAKAPDTPGGDIDSLDWTDVTMPASVHYALYKAGKIANPWYADNFKQLQWIQDSDWLLRTTFTVPEAWKGKVIRLRFDGMDYLGSIWLDGKYLGSHAGMFGGPTLDVTASLSPGSTHTLMVRLLHGLDDAETMKSRAQMGHRSWGNMYRTIGLWQPVRLVATGAAYLEAPYVRTVSIANNTATLFAQAMVLNTGERFTGTIHARILDAASNKVVWEADFDQAVPRGTSFWEQGIKIAKPNLWWPNGMGPQNLYRIELSLSRGKSRMDSIDARFGIRTLTIERNPYLPDKPRSNPQRPDVWSLDVKPAPEPGNSVPWGRPDLWAADTAVDDDALHNSDESYRYLFVVNGRPVYGKGVCWMTQDDILALDPDREKWLIRAAKNAGINFFRLNGGNCLLETDRFYQQCDENGILVWQDLQFCWHRDSKIPLTVWREQLKQSVLRLRQHPSLAVYVGGNEFSPYAVGLITYMGIAREIVASYDDRPWRINSPSAGSHHSYFAHGLFNEQAFLDLWIGDPNSYIRWFGENVNFVSEWSLMSYANYSQLKRVLPASELGNQPVGYDATAFMAKHPVWHDRFTEADRVAKILWNRPSYYADFGKATIPEMIEYSQMSHAETYGYVFENWRAGFPYKGGETVWTYNSHSPLSDWSIIDWFGQPKITYYAVKRAFEPVHVYGKTFLTWGAGDEFMADVGAVNDASAPAQQREARRQGARQQARRGREQDLDRRPARQRLPVTHQDHRLADTRRHARELLLPRTDSVRLRWKAALPPGIPAQDMGRACRSNQARRVEGEACRDPAHQDRPLAPAPVGGQPDHTCCKGPRRIPVRQGGASQTDRAKYRQETGLSRALIAQPGRLQRPLVRQLLLAPAGRAEGDRRDGSHRYDRHRQRHSQPHQGPSRRSERHHLGVEYAQGNRSDTGETRQGVVAMNIARSLALIAIGLIGLSAMASAADYDGTYCSGKGDVGYLRLIDQSFGFFHANPYRQNISMLYLGKEERLCET